MGNAGSICPNLPADQPIIGQPSESAASNQSIGSDHSRLIGKGHEHYSRQDKSSSDCSRVAGNDKLDRCTNLSNTTNKRRKRTFVVMEMEVEPEKGRWSTASTEDTACSRPTGPACPQCQRICGYSDSCWLAINCDHCNLSAFRDNLDAEFDIIVHHASGGSDHSRGKRPRILSS